MSILYSLISPGVIMLCILLIWIASSLILTEIFDDSGSYLTGGVLGLFGIGIYAIYKNFFT